ncbi:hypothetical protein [Sutcliffiella halmapala]|uniref:hypothetical protein n=1 Tax=Sutcliffiella halmapala TaxID=79882 RepID=UPI000995AB9D|nr:hypothetical protein [Sutcliffiella halmapala]
MYESKTSITVTGQLMIRRDAITMTPNGTFEGIVKYIAFEGEYKQGTLRLGKQAIACFTANPDFKFRSDGESKI